MSKFSLVLLLTGILFLTSCAAFDSELHSEISYEQFVESKHYFTTENGHQMAYIDRGKGDVILLVHGVPTSAWLYRHIIDNLVERGYRVIAPDMLGFGSSDKPHDIKHYQSTAQAARLTSLMKHLSINNWAQVVHDAGGLWSWPMLAENADKLDGLILLNTIAFTSGFKPPFKLHEGHLARKFSNLYCSPITCIAAMKSTLLNGIASSKVISHTEARGYWKPFINNASNSDSNNCEGLYQFYSQTAQLTIDNTELFSTLSSAKIPSAVIWGAKDDVLRWSLQSELIIQNLDIQDKDIHILDKNKHFIQEESPRTIARIVDEFLSYNSNQ